MAPPPDLGVVPAAAPVAATSGKTVSSVDDVGSLAATHGRTALPPEPPVGVRLPGAKQAVVTPIKAGRDGVLEPPGRVTEVGWWQGGAAVGADTGSIVLTGHVDAADQGIGTVAELWTARPGQTVDLTTADGRDVRYRITARRSYPRSSPLPTSLFSADVANRLVLITCAGRFDTGTRHYTDSLVVFAVPL